MSLNEQLNVLEGSSLIRRFAMQSEVEYLFRHALVQEAAYSAVLHADRRHLHRIVGQTLERLYVDRLDAVAGLLAEHYGKAADDAKAAEYAIPAADAAERMYAHPEARGHYARALAALDPPQWDEAEAHLRESLRLLDECGASLGAAHTHVAWTAICSIRGDAASAQKHLSFAQRQFEASGITSEL